MVIDSPTQRNQVSGYERAHIQLPEVQQAARARRKAQAGGDERNKERLFLVQRLRDVSLP